MFGEVQDSDSDKLVVKGFFCYDVVRYRKQWFFKQGFYCGEEVGRIKEKLVVISLFRDVVDFKMNGDVVFVVEFEVIDRDRLKSNGFFNRYSIICFLRV